MAEGAWSWGAAEKLEAALGRQCHGQLGGPGGEGQWAWRGQGAGRPQRERGFATRWAWALIAFCYFAADLGQVSSLNSGLLCKAGEKAELAELFTSFNYLVIQQKGFLPGT